MTKSENSRSGSGPMGAAATVSEPSGTQSPKSTRRKLTSKRFRRVKPRDPIQEISEALEQTRSAAEGVNNAAIHLNTLVLNDCTTLAAEATIVRDAATLLQHVVQNFRHSALLQSAGFVADRTAVV